MPYKFPYYKNIKNELIQIYDQYLPLAWKSEESKELDLPKAISEKTVKKSGVPYRENPLSESQHMAVFLEELELG